MPHGPKSVRRMHNVGTLNPLQLPLDHHRTLKHLMRYVSTKSLTHSDNSTGLRVASCMGTGFKDEVVFWLPRVSTARRRHTG